MIHSHNTQKKGKCIFDLLSQTCNLITESRGQLAADDLIIYTDTHPQKPQRGRAEMLWRHCAVVSFFGICIPRRCCLENVRKKTITEKREEKKKLWLSATLASIQECCSSLVEVQFPVAAGNAYIPHPGENWQLVFCLFV